MTQSAPASGAERDPIPQLIDRARDGSKSSLGRLLILYRPYLLAAACERLRQAFHSKVGPSDIVQKTMHDAVVGLPRFRGQSPQEFTAWLLRILNNRVIDVVRTYSGPEQDIRREIPLDGGSASGPSVGRVLVDPQPPQAGLDAQEDGVLLWQLAESLSPRDQALLAFRYRLNLSVDEIAALLEINEAAARKRLQRALRRLNALARQSGIDFDS